MNEEEMIPQSSDYIMDGRKYEEEVHMPGLVPHNSNKSLVNNA